MNVSFVYLNVSPPTPTELEAWRTGNATGEQMNEKLAAYSGEEGHMDSSWSEIPVVLLRSSVPMQEKPQ